MNCCLGLVICLLFARKYLRKTKLSYAVLQLFTWHHLLSWRLLSIHDCSLKTPIDCVHSHPPCKALQNATALLTIPQTTPAWSTAGPMRFCPSTRTQKYTNRLGGKIAMQKMNTQHVQAYTYAFHFLFCSLSVDLKENTICIGDKFTTPSTT